MESNEKKKFGDLGEDSASRYLIENGYEIIERNYRFKKTGEIDIIARKNNLVVFVEVKSRHFHYYGGPLYSINEKKKKTLRFIAAQFLISHPHLNSKDTTFRFDMISILNGKIELIEDIFR